MRTRPRRRHVRFARGRQLWLCPSFMGLLCRVLFEEPAYGPIVCLLAFFREKAPWQLLLGPVIGNALAALAPSFASVRAGAGLHILLHDAFHLFHSLLYSLTSVFDPSGMTWQRISLPRSRAERASSRVRLGVMPIFLTSAGARSETSTMLNASALMRVE